jgi:hypothetical protein
MQLLSVQLLEMADNSIDRRNLMFGRFFRHAGGQAGHFILKADSPD